MRVNITLFSQIISRLDRSGFKRLVRQYGTDYCWKVFDIEFKDLPYYRQEVEKRGVIKYHPGDQPTKM